ITTVTFDLENGLLSDESNAVNFTVTAGSLRRIDEDEPNDSPELATEVSIPVIVDGKTAKGDAGEVTIRFDNGSTEVLTDLFYLSLDKTTAMTIALEFTQTADLDLFVLAENSLGMFEVLASSTKTQGTSEKLTGSLSAGNYLIAIGVFSGSSAYSLTLQAGTPTAFSPFNSLAPTANNNVRFPVLVERKKLW
ncbi:MAG TPA: hypothetical protein PLD20_28775, partial [Blastocatellia bacterium]|nr:hypothetical protein [Blastocatellia bacterium]